MLVAASVSGKDADSAIINYDVRHLRDCAIVNWVTQYDGHGTYWADRMSHTPYFLEYALSLNYNGSQ